MKNLLVPTDFSEYAEAALEYAAFIAKIRKSTIHILTVVHSTDEDEYNKAEEQFKVLLKKNFLANTKVETYIKIDGDISEKIIECAEEVKTDLILMGSNGASSVSEILMGSNTEKVVRKSVFNVLTIKHKMANMKIDSIVFASDFSAESNRIFSVVRDFADKFNAQIHLLKINTPTHFEPTRVSMEKINYFIENEGLSPIVGDKYKIALYSDSTQELGILNYCIENEIDMVALGTHKHSFWQLMFESTSKNLVSHCFRPVLTIPIPE
jgi:nucleotide-binding universal stress UspA family protein